MKIFSLEEIIDKEEEKIIKELRNALSIMFKKTIFLKDNNAFKNDLRKIIEEEIKQVKGVFRILMNEKDEIEGMYYIKLNDKEKFLEPFFEIELVYSKKPSTFFRLLVDAKKSMEQLKRNFPEVKQFLGYYTTDDEGKPLSHAKIANKRVQEVFGLDKSIEKKVFITSIIVEK